MLYHYVLVHSCLYHFAPSCPGVQDSRWRTECRFGFPVVREKERQRQIETDWQTGRDRESKRERESGGIALHCTAPLRLAPRRTHQMIMIALYRSALPRTVSHCKRQRTEAHNKATQRNTPHGKATQRSTPPHRAASHRAAQQRNTVTSQRTVPCGRASCRTAPPRTAPHRTTHTTQRGNPPHALRNNATHSSNTRDSNAQHHTTTHSPSTQHTLAATHCIAQHRTATRTLHWTQGTRPSIVRVKAISTVTATQYRTARAEPRPQT